MPDRLHAAPKSVLRNLDGKQFPGAICSASTTGNRAAYALQGCRSWLNPAADFSMAGIHKMPVIFLLTATLAR